MALCPLRHGRAIGATLHSIDTVEVAVKPAQRVKRGRTAYVAVAHRVWLGSDPEPEEKRPRTPDTSWPQALHG